MVLVCMCRRDLSYTTAAISSSIFANGLTSLSVCVCVRKRGRNARVREKVGESLGTWWVSA